MNYVVHFCKNKNCNNAWVDKDLTHTTTIPPKWKYCKECAEKLGINYEKQTPESNLTLEQLEIRNKTKERFKKIREQRKENIKSDMEINRV